MERFIKEYDREFMKRAMVKHEETFKHQVHELHRLYRVQKLLMNEMKNAELKREGPRMTLDPELPSDVDVGKDGGDLTVEVEEESDLELTLATGSRRRRKKKDASFTSDSGASFSSCSAESDGAKLNDHKWPLFQVAAVNLSFQSERKSSFDVEEQMREERVKHPHWLYQCMGLNMT